jgi:hypothetical protein
MTMEENGLTHFEVTSVVEGALNDTRAIPLDADDPDEIAEGMARELHAASTLTGPFDWAVYVMPHYCGYMTDNECLCVQWLTSHAPIFESSTYQGGNDNG